VEAPAAIQQQDVDQPVVTYRVRGEATNPCEALMTNVFQTEQYPWHQHIGTFNTRPWQHVAHRTLQLTDVGSVSSSWASTHKLEPKPSPSCVQCLSHCCFPPACLVRRYALNVWFNLLNKSIFKYFPFPYTVSTVHVVVGTAYCLLVYILGLKKWSFSRVRADEHYLRLLRSHSVYNSMKHRLGMSMAAALPMKRSAVRAAARREGTVTKQPVFCSQGQHSTAPRHMDTYRELGYSPSAQCLCLPSSFYTLSLQPTRPCSTALYVFESAACDQAGVWHHLWPSLHARHWPHCSQHQFCSRCYLPHTHSEDSGASIQRGAEQVRGDCTAAGASHAHMQLSAS
jgi:hypothetical protein